MKETIVSRETLTSLYEGNTINIGYLKINFIVAT